MVKLFDKKQESVLFGVYILNLTHESKIPEHIFRQIQEQDVLKDVFKKSFQFILD
jgi:hypothetical protein